ncbi:MULTISPECIES: molecular chaperone DnaJ [unclassified Synechococcus]|uniref:molecular chaperone DnaJ n=1 Tax=unclassified Synechococcus TaxID=2626047 RepID=UPI002AD5152C|nr:MULTISPECIES: molecular chaperone DnaJ [unclassified Synechococcus]
MPQTLRERSMPLVVSRFTKEESSRSASDPGAASRGFGGSGTERNGRRRKTGKKKTPALSQADWGPLGKHPDLDAIVARQRLHLPLSGRIRESDVTRAWKNAAAEHHPDRGGAHDTMQRVNGARDLLLGRGRAGC